MEKVQYIPGKEFAELPKTAGVYFFYTDKELLYIGKAINLRDRVKSHFMQPSYRDHLYIEKVNRIGFIDTHSEIEALVLEASLIKEHLPKWNVVWKDGKNYFFVAVSKNAAGLPWIFWTHQKRDEKAEYIGPFVDGQSLKRTLKMLRKPFPYYSAAKHPKVKCMYCHLDLCPGPILMENPPSPEALALRKEYEKNIRRLVLILQGKRQTVLKTLRTEMKEASKAQDFEKAAKVRDQYLSLEKVLLHTHVLEKEFAHLQSAGETLQKILGLEKPANKIECYDISNIQGKMAVGSMVVFEDDKPSKSQYKKFRIRMENEPNDIAMLKEVFTRRLTHPEWMYPDVMLIDGGKAQLNAAIEIKNKQPETANIKVISIAKGRQELFIEGRKIPIALKQLPQEVYNIIVSLDDEAHRFAVSYHRNVRKKNLLK